MKAVCNLLGIESPETPIVTPQSSPEPSLFVAVFKEFVKGIPPSKGYKFGEGLVGQQKALQILWLILEAFNDKPCRNQRFGKLLDRARRA